MAAFAKTVDTGLSSVFGTPDVAIHVESMGVVSYQKVRRSVVREWDGFGKSQQGKGHTESWHDELTWSSLTEPSSLSRRLTLLCSYTHTSTNSI